LRRRRRRRRRTRIESKIFGGGFLYGVGVDLLIAY
jgi:hypothetical protein